MHAQVSYCKNPGMTLENWDVATRWPLAEVSTNLECINHSSCWID